MKLDLFKDKEYDGFDWLNKAVEPIIYPLSEMFSQIPMETEFSMESVIRMAADNYMSIGVDRLILMAAKSVHLEIRNDEILTLKPYFDVVFEELEFNAKDIPKDKAVKLIKTKQSLDDNEIRAMVAQRCRTIIGTCKEKMSDIGRMNEVMDILGCKEDRKSRSVNYKRAAIAGCFETILVEDKWRIRNMNIAIKAAEWMRLYIEVGNLAAMSSFIKLKCMTHSGNPIYSVQETI